MQLKQLELAGGGTLTVYLRDCCERMPNVLDRPLVLVVPGGGYTHVSPREDINSNSFITTKLPKTLPNNRIHNDVGLIASSSILIGSMIGTGSAKLCRKPLSPRL